MAKKEAKKENSKNKKSFFKDFKAELKKVSWPTPKQLVNNTVAVITIVLITAVIVFVLDIVFETLNKQGIDKVRDLVVTDETTNETTDDSEATDDSETDGTTENTEATDESEGTETDVTAENATSTEGSETNETTENSETNETSNQTENTETQNNE